MSDSQWVEVGPVVDLQRKGKLVIEHGGKQVLVLWHEDRPTALDNVCIHKQRELSKGVILNRRIVCPGHQWAFELETGFCRERERSQPVYQTKIHDDVVLVDLSAPVPAPVELRATSER
jgi:nitrite reductase (NADH) small subunit